MKKMLILTASTGGGHNSVARTLSGMFEGQYDIEVLDFIREESKVLELLIEEGYDMLATDFPTLYGRLYNSPIHNSLTASMTERLSRALYRRTHQIIKKKQPDIILGAHTFSVHIVNRLKKKGHYNGLFVSFVTDFEAHHGYIASEVDLYITASEYTNNSLIEKGIDKNRIKSLGIPVDQKFRVELDIEKGVDFTALIMGGSMGMSSMIEVIRNLLKTDEPFKMIIVCGRDESLKKKLENVLKGTFHNKEVILHGFVDNVEVLMSKADLIISKPGGLTTSEAIVKGLPMLVPYYIPGQEEENLEYLTLANLAIPVGDLDNIGQMVEYLIKNPQRLESVRESMKREASTYSPQETVAAVNGLFQLK